MENRFTPPAQKAIEAALPCAASLGHTYIGTEHLLLGLCACDTGIDSGVACRILAARKITYDTVFSSIVRLSGSGDFASPKPTDMTPRLRHIIEAAGKEAARHGSAEVGTEHLLMALISEGECVASRIIIAHGVKLSDIYTDLSVVLSIGAETGTRTHKKSVRDTPNLKQYGRNLCELAAKGSLSPVVGRTDELSRLIRILCRKNKNNPCLIGEAGVGKTAVVEGLAQRINAGSVPPDLLGVSIISLDLTAMLAGAKYRGEFEERLKGVMNEVSDCPEIILFIDELHTIAGAGAAEGAVDAANIMKPALGRGEIRVIGATTISEYRRVIEKDGALSRRFQTVVIEEPTEEEAVLMLNGQRPGLEKHHGIKISDDAVLSAVLFSARYITDRFLPDKALDLLDEACAAKRSAAIGAVTSDSILIRKAAAIREGNFKLAAELSVPSASCENLCVTSEDISSLITVICKIPAGSLKDGEAKRLLSLEEEICKKVIGQEGVVKEVCSAVRRSRSGLCDPCRPCASFLFLGSSGVGKTELCRALSECLFKSNTALLRFDMSEYAEKHTVSRLIGSPPGYIGHTDGGQLTEKVRRKPYSIILFDEAEKAHPDIFNLLLQVLEEGELTDSCGVTVNFRNTVVILTSNIGTRKAGQSGKTGFTNSAVNDGKEARLTAARTLYPPELLNRLDGICVFEDLSEASLRTIAKGFLTKLEQRAKSLNITLSFGESAVNGVLKEAKIAAGARGIRSSVCRIIEEPLSMMIINSEIVPGDCVICELVNGEFTAKKTVNA